MAAVLSPRRALDDASIPANDWGGTAGWWSARSPGCSAVVASASATSDGLPCAKGSSTWPAACFASSFLPQSMGDKTVDGSRRLTPPREGRG
ncbi:MAG: hypothetical protein K0S78_5980 [Thermomicrobiales bacterium]|nr:hypothetical protein [Thermomicrobiales bacterium]MDF3042948.1 hypothetical protein [Thermomicrobiales bacterium]